MLHRHLINRIINTFGIEGVEIADVQKGYRNESYRLSMKSGERINLIIHKVEPDALERIRSADYAAEFLLAADFPVRTRFDARTLKISDGRRDVYAGLYSYIPGKTIPWEAYTKNHIKLLGWAMADMHGVWKSRRAASDFRITHELDSISRRMERYFADSNVRSAVKHKLKIALSANFKAHRSLFNQFDTTPGSDEHILHMDLVRGNVLFDSTGSTPWVIGGLALTGVIDFEKAATGHPVFDIARTLAFLIVDCANKDQRSIVKYFLQSGYNKRGGGSVTPSNFIVSLPTHSVLTVLIGFFLLHDFYKFLRHTPYESLSGNHHFIRTRDILIDYGMIRLI